MNLQEERLYKTDRYYAKTPARALFYLLFWIDFRDPVAWSLLITNAITIVMAIEGHWSASNLIVIYWLQCLFIGFFNLLKMLRVKTEAVKEIILVKKGDTVSQFSALLLKIILIIMFISFYWTALFSYLIYIIADLLATRFLGLDFRAILIATTLFFINHLISFVKNNQRDRNASISVLAFHPFIRVAPMMLVAFFMAISPDTFLGIFLVLKTFVDLKSYHWERFKFYKPTEEEKQKMLEWSSSHSTSPNHIDKKQIKLTAIFISIVLVLFAAFIYYLS